MQTRLRIACAILLAGVGICAHATAAFAACSDLAAPGVWQRITPSGILAAQAIALDPLHPGTLYFGASPDAELPDGSRTRGPGGFFKSLDCGSHWTKMNTGTNGAQIDTASLWSIAVDFSDPDVVYAVGAYGPNGLLKTTNGGVDWQQLIAPGSDVANAVPYAFIASVSMDPGDHRHLVAGTHNDCLAPHTPGCQAETLDGGVTWRIVDVPGDHWREGAGPYVLDATTWVFATPFAGLWVTTNGGAQWRDVTPSGAVGATNGENTHRPFARAADGAYYLSLYKQNGLGGGVVRSTNGVDWQEVPNSPHASVTGGALAFGDGRIFFGDHDAMIYKVALLSDLSNWSSLPDNPALVPLPGQGEGAVFLEYDETQHILYSSNWEGGVWRIVIPVSDRIFADGFD